MPSLGADMEKGTLVEWLVEAGQRVERGDLIAVVETQKGAIEVEVWTPGTVTALLVEEGTTAEVGTVLATIDEDGAAVSEASRVPGSAPSAPAPLQPSPASEPVVQASPKPRASRTRTDRVLASPWARHLAAARGVDLAGLTGTGSDGAILGADVPDKAPVPKKTEHKGPDLDAMRQAVARAMAKSKREIPHYYLGTDIDLSAALTWMERTNAAVPPPDRLLPAALLLKATALAVREVPEVNGFWTDGAFCPSDRVHLGVAVSLRGGGLVAPALHDADQRPLVDLMKALSDLVRRARRGRLRGSEMMDATLTVTSLGDRGVRHVDGIIYPPQVAIVGFGRIETRPWVVDGQIVPRPVVSATLAGDHRAHDGHRGGLYLAAIERLLSEPEAL
jgi:pyruvate dehydrogenase E2 component (dihydrolipoamide acetyltransferase)